MKSRFPHLAVLSFFLVAAGPSGRIHADSGNGGGNPLPGSPQASSYLHPDFDFTEKDFASRLDGMPPSVLSDPRGFLGLASAVLDLPEGYLRFLNPEFPLPPNFIPKNLVPLDALSGVLVIRCPMELDRIAAEELDRLVRAASRDGIDLLISSAYRSWQYQDEVFERHVRLFGEEKADGMSRRPGTSQHQLGTSVDFGKLVGGPDGSDPSDWRNWRFIEMEDAAWSWLSVHAGLYGWSLSYPPETDGYGGIAAEPWHWRWIGPEAVALQDEFFDGSQPALLRFWTANAETLKASLIDDSEREAAL